MFILSSKEFLRQGIIISFTQNPFFLKISDELLMLHGEGFAKMFIFLKKNTCQI